MNKVKNWYNAVIETAENNYFLELVKIWNKKYWFTVYSEWDAIRNIAYKFAKLKKSDFTSCIIDFLNWNWIKNFNFMDY